MSTPVNYYHGMKRGKGNNPGDVVVATTTQGSAVDVEVRLQIDNGTATTGLTIIDVKKILETILAEIVQRGITGSLGTNLPAN